MLNMMEKIELKIAQEFTDAPGSRDSKDGAYSGEDFYQTLLKKKFDLAKKEGKLLLIDFDNSWGYASSFISGAFGRLADFYGVSSVMQTLDFKSEDDPSLILKVKKEIERSIKK